jgi:hypothetical protein
LKLGIWCEYYCFSQGLYIWAMYKWDT